MSVSPDKSYVFSNDTLHFFSYDDIFAMYENGMSIKQISRKLSRILGLTVSACTAAVSCAIYERVLPVACSHPACSPFLFYGFSTSQDEPAVAFEPPLPPSPFPHSWAVGDFCCRRR